MPLRLHPFPHLLHPPSGRAYNRLPVTRDGVRRVPAGELVRSDRPAFGELRITTLADSRPSRGICGLLPAAAFLDGSVRPHEQTLLSRLQRQEEVVMADEGGMGKPVLITVPSLAEFWETLARERAAGSPLVTFNGRNNDYELRLLRPSDGSPQPLSLADFGPVCIADGHHRAETHARLAARGYGQCARVPVCLIGADELTIGVFTREIVPRFAVGELPERLAPYFEPTEITLPLAPAHPGEWLLARAGKYYALRRRDSGPDNDATWLNATVLPRVFGITDTRADERISFNPVATTPGEPVDYAFPPDRTVLIGFPLPPAVFFREVAAGKLLPPKSTRFEPRVPSGLVVWPGC